MQEHFNKPSNHREFRLADQIQKDLAKLFHLEVKDPRISFITITDVELSTDFSLARVFYSTFPSDSKRLADTQAGLEAVLKFIYDDSLERGRFLSNLIDEACHKSIKKN